MKIKTKFLYFAILCHISLDISLNLKIQINNPIAQGFHLLNTIIVSTHY